MIPYVRKIEFEYGVVEQVSPLIRRVIANNPGPFTYTGTGTYIVGHGEVAVIDPGPDLADHLAAILRAVGAEKITAMPITHHHGDHSPLAAPLQAAAGGVIYGCPIQDHTEEEEGAPVMEAGHDLSFRPDVNLCAGGTISGPGWTLEAIHTPGHTSNHICYALKEEDALFSGDHIMGWSTTGITPPDGDMADYIKSLELIRDKNFTTIWPTHGPPIRDPRPLVQGLIDHRHERANQILRALETGPARIRDLVPNLYSDVDPKLWPAASRSMLANMVYLARTGRITTDGEAGPQSEFRLV